MQTSAPPRIVSFDILRILSAISVVMIHVAMTFIMKNPLGSAAFRIGCFFSALSRYAVPVFFMISGALMLNQDKPREPKSILLRALQMYLLFWIWSVFYSLVNNIAFPLLGHGKLSLDRFISDSFSGHYHMWFLFTIIGLYIITPFLRLVIRRENKKYIDSYLLVALGVEFIWPVCAFCIKRLAPGWRIINFHINEIDLFVFSEYLTYFILGWYLNNFQFSDKKKKLIYILGGVGLAATFLCGAFLNTEEIKAYDFFFSPGALGVLLFSVAVFVFVKDFPFRRTPGFVTGLSGLTFGVYMIHVFVLEIVEKFTASIPVALLRLGANFAATVAISFGVVLVISKIPLVKKLVRG